MVNVLEELKKHLGKQLLADAKYESGVYKLAFPELKIAGILSAAVSEKKRVYFGDDAREFLDNLASSWSQTYKPRQVVLFLDSQINCDEILETAQIYQGLRLEQMDMVNGDLRLQVKPIAGESLKPMESMIHEYYDKRNTVSHDKYIM
ncbi:MAG: hypothetical protein ABIF10_07495 [Candidatus Woesearchaeota archaeon]